MNDHEALVDDAAGTARTAVLVGGLDAGKTTLARQLLARALERGRRPALVDADVGQKAVGPPTTVGLKLIRTPEDLEPGVSA